MQFKIVLLLAVLCSTAALAQRPNILKAGIPNKPLVTDPKDPDYAGIEWFKGNLAEAKTEAAAKGLPIFIDCYTTWCGPCKQMEKTVYPVDTVGAFYNQYFINLKVDMEKGEGPEIAKLYGINAYPFYLFIDAEGTMLHQAIGGRPVSEFVKLCEVARNPALRIGGMMAQYKSGNTDVDFLKGYIVAAGEAGFPAEEPLEALFTQLKPSEAQTPEYWQILSRNHSKPGGAAYRTLLDNADYYQTLNKTDYQEIIRSMLLGNAKSALANQEPIAAVKADIAKAGYAKEEDAIISEAKIDHFFFDKRDYNAYAAELASFYKKYPKQETYWLNNHAWNLYERFSAKPQLDLGIAMAKQAIDEQPDPNTIDTYANLLYKAGRKPESLAWCNKGIAQAKLQNQRMEGTEALRDKIIAEGKTQPKAKK
jgi:thiol-disulfide isomerase/thioredoxin